MKNNSFNLFDWCRLLSEDNEHGLFSVTLFRKVADEFKHHARERRCVNGGRLNRLGNILCKQKLAKVQKGKKFELLN